MIQLDIYRIVYAIYMNILYVRSKYIIIVYLKMSSSLEFVVDPKIRDWVFMPIIYVTITVGMIRMYYTQYSTQTKEKDKVLSEDKALDQADK